jgi:hypothetical protein
MAGCAAFDGCVATGAVEALAVADDGGAFEGVAVGDEAAGCCVEVELLWQPAAQNSAAGSARVAMITLRYMKNFLLSEFAGVAASTRLDQHRLALDEQSSVGL